MQPSFGDARCNGKRKRTRRQVFLAEIHQVVPWKNLLALIERHYPRQGYPARQPYPGNGAAHPLLQQWYVLSAPAAGAPPYDMVSMRCFAKIDGPGDVPDAITMHDSRRLLEQQDLEHKLSNLVDACLGCRARACVEARMWPPRSLSRPPFDQQ